MSSVLPRGQGRASALISLLILSVLLLGGCDAVGPSQSNPLTELTYRVEEAPLTAGDSTILKLTNGTSSSIGYNLACSWTVQKTAGEWSDASIRRSDACFLSLKELESEETATTQIHIDSSATEGVYRFTMSVEVGEDVRSIYTEPFRIEPAGQ